MKKVLPVAMKLLEGLSSICLVVFCTTSFLQVVVRYLGFSLVWTEEIARFSFIYMVFTGCTVGVYRKSHYDFDVFGKMKNRVVSGAVHVFSYLFQIFFFVFLTYTSIKFVPQMHARASSILRIPVSIPYSSIILFAVISVIVVITQAIECFKGLRGRQSTEGLSGEVDK